MSSHHFHSIFHCKVTVGSSGAILRCFVQLLDNRFLHINGESSPCAELLKSEADVDSTILFSPTACKESRSCLLHCQRNGF